MLIIAMFFGSLNHRVKECINVLPPKISKQRFKYACPKLQADVTKADWKRWQKLEGSQRGAVWRGIAQLHRVVRIFYVTFLS